MPQDFLIIGTDTGVGKTYVATLLLRTLRDSGLPAMGYKPICCGDRADVRAMRDATEPGISLELMNPLYLRANADPYIAAELQRATIEPESLVAACSKLRAAGYGPILVEGVGGWETPLAPGYTMADLAEAFELPVLLVVANRQGAANHTLMTLRGMEARGLRCHGIILNHMGEEWDTAAVTNRKLIEEFTDVPVLAELIHGQEDIETNSWLI